MGRKKSITTNLSKEESKTIIKKLDLACGDRKQEGFIGVDRCSIQGVDIVHDLETYPWPFENESIDEIFCSHYIEHLSHNNINSIIKEVLDQSDDFNSFKDSLTKKLDLPLDGLILFMDECWRILKPEGKMIILVPYYTSMRSVQDPTHQRVICEASMLYFNKGWRVANKLDHYGIKSSYDYSYGYVFDPSWAVRSEDSRAFALKQYWNTVLDIQFSFTKRSGD